MKRLYLILILATFQVLCYAQQDTLVGTSAIDIPHGILSTQDGGYIVYGTTEGSGLGQADFMLLKYDINDTPLWSYTYGTTGIEGGSAIGLNQVPSGDLYLTGNWEQNAGVADRAVMIKMTPFGDIIWKRILVGTSGINADSFHDIKELADGNFLVSGWSESFSTGAQDATIAKFAPNGLLIEALSFGGGLNEQCYDIVLAATGFYVTHAGQSFGPGLEAVGMAFFDFDLNLIWNKMYGDVGVEDISDIHQISPTSFLMSGSTDSFGSERGFLMQTTDLGDIDWVKTVNIGAGEERLCDMLVLPDLSYLVAISSTTEGNAVLAKFNSTHTLQWARKNPLATSSSAVFRGDCLAIEADGMVGAVLEFNGLGAGQSDVEILSFDPNDGPCGWVGVALEVEDVAFNTEIVAPDELMGGGLSDFVLSRADLVVVGEGIYDCTFEECELEGTFVVENPCLDDELAFNYILDIVPTHGLTWEWTIGATVYPDSVPIVLLDTPGPLNVSLTLTNDSIDACQIVFDTLLQVIEIPTFNVLGPDMVCEGDEVDYEISIGVGNLTWMNDEVGDILSIVLDMDTLIQAVVEIAGCTDTADLQVIVDGMPTGELTGPSLFCNGEELATYEIDGLGYQTIVWNNGGSNLTSDYLINQDTLISVELVNGVCTLEDELAVQFVTIPAFEILGPTLVCEGTEVDYSLSINDGIITWMNGEIGQNISVTLSMDTLIEAFIDVNGCLDSTEVQILVDALPTGEIMGPLQVCPDELVTYSIDAIGYQTLEWNNGDNALSTDYLIDQDTLISVELINGVCAYVDEVMVDIIPDIELQLVSETTLCVNIEHTLEVSGGQGYEWSTGESGAEIDVFLNQDTTIWVTSTNGCMSDTAFVSITAVESEASNVEDVDLELEYGSNVLVDFPEDIPFDLFDLSGNLLCSDCFDFEFNLTGNESYYLEYIDPFDCVTQIPVNLSPSPCTEIYIPSSFTPDGDEINDHFQAVCYEPCVDYYYMRIFDRGGRLVFESFDLNEIWLGDGAIDGNYYVSDAVYSYRMLYSLVDSFEIIEKLGTVTIIR